jgi:hypothetical protein
MPQASLKILYITGRFELPAQSGTLTTYLSSMTYQQRIK